VRSCSEICVDADNHAQDVDYLLKLFKEVSENLKKYTIVELDFMHEHLSGHLHYAQMAELKNLFRKIDL
jgi:hypothetical protein